MSSARSQAIVVRSSEDRRDFATALLLGAICCGRLRHVGEALDAEDVLSQADEFLQYITGNNSAKVPRHDEPDAGKMPRL